MPEYTYRNWLITPMINSETKELYVLCEDYQRRCDDLRADSIELAEVAIDAALSVYEMQNYRRESVLWRL